ncbi:hypothetical protein FRC07_014738, partial [Ceratobasidium sp. 392]
NKLAGPQAISTVGAASGDDQVIWITKDSGIDHQNVRVAAAGSGQLAVVTWEQITTPKCQPVPLSCSGTFAGTYAQLVDATGTGSAVGAPINLGVNVTVSGDIATIGKSVCWPFVKQTWDLSKPKSTGTAVTKMSFACLSTDGSALTNTDGTTGGAIIDPVVNTTSTTAPIISSTSIIATDTPVAETSTIPQETTSTVPEPTSTAAPPSTATIGTSSVSSTTITTRPTQTRRWGRPHGYRY